VNQPVACREAEAGQIPLVDQVMMYRHLLDLIKLGLQSVYVIFLALQDGFEEFATSIVSRLHAPPDTFISNPARWLFPKPSRSYALSPCRL
jgi:hypothetical protein